tara:strand:- start:543 stop:887 length:345 start_codon:yes stop_codon:yes gene_type:complete
MLQQLKGEYYDNEQQREIEMKHARQDYNRIQDPDNKIPEDEPVFLIRGQDQCAVETLRFWATLNRHRGGDKVLSELAERHAYLMKKWQLEMSDDSEKEIQDTTKASQCTTTGDR